MISKREMPFVKEHYLGCFGRYRKSDLICRKQCALNLRCAIEHDRNERFEILEELASSSGLVIKIN